MGRFAWTQGHHKQPSEGKHMLPDWFSKSSGEPSRQALSDLLKEHKTTSPQSSTGTRSRSNTLNSAASRGHKSTSSRSSGSRPSRPASRQTQDATIMLSSPSRQDTANTLLSKGSKVVRRQTSKFHVLSSQQTEPTSSDHISRSHAIQRVKSAGQLLSLHSRREASRPQISGPFDFQHVTHTDQSQYQLLNKANKTDLVDSFQALQACQHPEHAIKGIPVDDLPSAMSATPRHAKSQPQSPTFSTVTSLPSGSPEPPTPPPKDDSQRAPAIQEIRLSRSADNFSWPTRSSPLVDLDLLDSQHPKSDYEPVGAPTMPPSPARPSETVTIPTPHFTPQLAPSPVLDKPLPQPPTIVHAVSTSDLSTLMMKSTPLPQVPHQQAHETASPSSSIPALNDSPTSPRSGERTSLRHVQSFPSARLFRQSGEMLSESGTYLDNVSAAETTSPSRTQARAEKRISVGIKTIDVDDWEDAIDYSWDHALDGDDDDELMEMNPPAALSKSDILPQSAFGPTRFSNFTPQTPALPPAQIRHHKSEMSLRGLGIKSSHRNSYLVGPAAGMTAEGRESLKVPRPYRISGSPMSKSSSQESIILSIASSIMSTHRSSNSSTSLGDTTHLMNFEDDSGLLMMGRPPDKAHKNSISSSETVTKDNRIDAIDQHGVQEDTLEDLPSLKHERGISGPKVPFTPNRRSSLTPAAKANARKRASTLSTRPRNNSRASYSLFPAASTPPAAPMAT